MCKVPNLFELMKAQNITQKQLSENIGVSTGNISDWKTGRSSPSIDALLKIAQFFNVSVDYILTGKEKSSAPELTETELELIEKFNRLTDIDKGRMLDRIETIYQGYSPEEKENVS